MRLALAAAAVLLALPAVASAQDATPIVGGGSFNTAPLLEPGRYSDTVAAGETVYWKVKLAKGQVMRVRATVDRSEIEDDLTKSTYLSGLDHLDYIVELWSPLREPLGEVNGWEDASTTLEGGDETGSRTGEAVSPRALGYEQILGSDYTVDKFPAPGEWFVSLSAADSDIFPAELPAELPVELDVSVEGTAEASSPDFAAKLPGPTPEPTADALIGADAGAGDPALTIGLVAILCLLGGLGLGALATRLLVH